MKAGPRSPALVHQINSSAGFQDLPAQTSGSLRRFEFVSACEVLLADTPGCASVSDLHDLFDLLDPGCTGSVPLNKFSALLRAHQKPSTKKGAPIWSDLGDVGSGAASDFRLKSALSGLRNWMLQHNFLFQDLANVLDGESQRLPWPEFGELLVAGVKPPWATLEGAKEIFDQLAVIATVAGAHVADDSSLPSHEVRVNDLIQALLDAKPFAQEMANRTVRVVFREAHIRKVDVKQQFLVEDRNRTGVVDYKQLSKVVNSICPNCLADADIKSIAGKFPSGSKFRYDNFLKALESERCLYAEHLLKRALPKLMSQAAAFLQISKDVDRGQQNWLNAAQLRHAMSKLELGLEVSPNLAELDDFIDMLIICSRLDKDKFKYGKLVNKKEEWIGPGVEECVTVICGTATPKEYDDDAKVVLAPKAHLLTILYYKIAETSRELGLSTERAFERLDRGGKGYLNAQDLRLAVLDVLGMDEDLASLGLKADTIIRIAKFQQNLEFNLDPLCSHIPEVFGTVELLKEPDFIEGFKKKGADEVLLKNWLQLLCPTGVPPAGVDRSICETFFATRRSPTGSVAPIAGERDAVQSLALRAARKALHQKLKDLRGVIVQVLSSGDGQLPIWLHRKQASKLLNDHLAQEEADEIFSAVERTSALYEPSRDVIFQVGASELRDAFRTENLLACAEDYDEHILEVRLERVVGLQFIREAIMSHDRPLEFSLRYWCRGTEYVAETARLPLNGTSRANSSDELNFKAVHTFRMSKLDSLLPLFEFASDALNVQAWGGVVHEPRQLLGRAVLPSSDLRKFLVAAASKTRTPETLLGSQKEWKISFAELPGTQLTISVLYSRQSPQNQMTPPLPWPSTFSGSLVLCHRSPVYSETRADFSGPSAASPSPGAVKLEVRIRAIALHGFALKSLLASCLEGCAMPSPVAGAGLGLFIRFCLFPGNPTLQVAGGCGWVQSTVTTLPEELFTESGSSFLQKKVFDARLDFVWHSPMLDAAEVVAALQQGKASMELWLRTACVPSSQSSWRVQGRLAADVRLAEAHLNLKDLLRAASPEVPEKLQMRTLRNVSIDPIVAFKTEKSGAILADLISSVSMELPHGPSVVSWLVEPDDVDSLVSYTVRLQEVWLSKEFVTGLDRADRVPRHGFTHGASPHAMQSGPQYYYAEFGQGGPHGLGGPASPDAPTSTLPYYRSAPVQAQKDSGGWLRVPLDGDARVVLPKRPALGASASTDAQIHRGEHHGMRVRVLQLVRGGGTRLAADVAMQLPLGDVSEGGIGPFFGVRFWRPLFHAVPDAPSMVTIGRALLTVEAQYPSDQVDAPKRILRALPEMPSGVFLPLYSSWKVPMDAHPWPLEGHLRAFLDALYPDLWLRLASVDERSGTKGTVPVDEFEAAFEASDLGRELFFFKSTVPSFFSAPGCSVPWIPFLYWLALQDVARRILPMMRHVLPRLQQIDGAKGQLAGTVPLSTFQQALREELRNVSIAGELATLSELIANRPQWALGTTEFCGHQHFDYFVFLWDLNAASSEPNVLLGEPPLPSNPVIPSLPGDSAFQSNVDCGNDQQTLCTQSPSAMLTIASALHLRDIGPNRPPSTFATYCWGRVDDDGGLRDSDRLGCTEIFPRDNNPKWGHMASLVLPQIERANRLWPYPDAFRTVALVLHVWCVNEWNGTHRLLGTARVSLEPLRLGFAEIDGYYDIQPCAGTGSQSISQIPLQGVQGQIRVSLTPHWAPTPSIPNRQLAQSLQPELWTSSEGPRPSPSIPVAHGTRPSPHLLPAPGAELLRMGNLRYSQPSSMPIEPDRFPSMFPAEPGSLPLGFSDRAHSPVLPTNPSVARRLPSVFTSSRECERALDHVMYRPALFDPTDPDLFALGQGPGVDDDVSTTALRFAFGVSVIERQLQSLQGSEEVQLEKLREMHSHNMSELSQLQEEKLKKLEYKPPRNMPTKTSLERAGTYSPVQVPPMAVAAPAGVAICESPQQPSRTVSSLVAPTTVSLAQVEPFATAAAASVAAAAIGTQIQPAITSIDEVMVHVASWPTIGDSNLLPNLQHIGTTPSMPVPRVAVSQPAADAVSSHDDAVVQQLIGHAQPAADAVSSRDDAVVQQLIGNAQPAADAVSFHDDAVVQQLIGNAVIGDTVAPRVQASEGGLRHATHEQSMQQESSDESMPDSVDAGRLPQFPDATSILLSPAQPNTGEPGPNPSADVASGPRFPNMASSLLSAGQQNTEEWHLPTQLLTGGHRVSPTNFGVDDEDFANLPIGRYVGLGENQLRPQSFTFRRDYLSETSDSMSVGEVLPAGSTAMESPRSRQELLWQVGQDVLEEHHLYHGTAV